MLLRSFSSSCVQKGKLQITLYRAEAVTRRTGISRAQYYPLSMRLLTRSEPAAIYVLVIWMATVASLVITGITATAQNFSLSRPA